MLAGVERLLESLTGVYSAHVVAGPEGTLQEIHVLATTELHPKQVVRNVESALSAGLGIEIDRRIVSVAQVSPDALPAAESFHAEAVANIPHAPAGPATRRRSGAPAGQSWTTTPDAAAEGARIVYLGYDANIDAARRATCTVALRIGSDEYTGRGNGHDTPLGRAEAAARATFAALAVRHGEDRLGLEGVAIVTAHGREFVLVAARALDGRRRVSLTGAAHLHNSPEEAAIYASLQATNRWRGSE